MLRLASTAIVIVLSACRPAPPVTTTPSADVIDTFRVALADPAKHRLREGLKLDEDALRAALDSFRAEHHELLEQRFLASVAALPRSEAPASPAFGLVVELPGGELDGFAEATRLNWQLDPDATKLALTNIGMTLPILMSHHLGMTTADIGRWMTFLRAAKPAIGVCKRSDTEVTVCVSYGGLDVFLVSLQAGGGAWGLSALSWQQRGRVAR